MATSKSILGTDQLQSALTSEIGPLVTGALAEIEEQPPSQHFAQVLHGALVRIKDPILAFQTRKTLKMLTLSLAGKKIPDSFEDLNRIINQMEKLEDIALVIGALKPASASKVSDLLRNSKWEEWPVKILPNFCSHFKKFGTKEDAKSIGGLAGHFNPHVLLGAIEALERIEPSNLQSLIPGLLENPSFQVRAKAAQLLYRWNPGDALQFIVEFLFSGNPAQQALTLFYSQSIPFAEVEPHLLRFIGENSDPQLLNRVNKIFQASAHTELAFKIYKIYRTLRDAHKDLVKGIIIGVVRALDAKKALGMSPQEFLDQLKNQTLEEEGQLVRHAETTQVEEPERDPGVEEGPSGIGEEPAFHTDVEVFKDPQAASAAAKDAHPEPPEHGPRIAGTKIEEVGKKEILSEGPTPAVFENLTELDGKGKILALTNMSRENFLHFRPQVPKLLQELDGKELASLIRLVGRYGTTKDIALLKNFLRNQDHQIVCAAIDALSNLEAEELPLFLPQLIQHSKGRVRMHASRAFVKLDREQGKSLIGGMLQSASPKQRLMAVPIAMQVDFSLVRDNLLKTLASESSIEVIQKIGVVLAANPDREILRVVFNLMKQSSGEYSKTFRDMTGQIALNLSVVLGKISRPEDLISGEETSFATAREKPAVLRKSSVRPVSSFPADSRMGAESDEVKKFITIAMILLALNWILLVGFIVNQSWG